MAENHATWKPLCALAETEIGRPHYAEFCGRAFCVARLAEFQVQVVGDTCPHAGASLSAGRVVNGCVECPWHAWEFDLETGRCTDNSSIGIAVLRSRVHAGMVEVAVDPANGQPLNAQPPRPSAV